ncbi:DEAD/DEAH box helicase [Candidatus Saccharibacteria bacterium]|nr:DEAD/DEAH box helicase [Candidatus Saccharibacteria bacterium]
MQKSYHSGAQRRRNFAPHKRRQSNNRGGKAVQASRFINKAVEPQAETVYVPTHTFHDFGLNQKTISTLEYLNFTTPSPIQDQTIAPALEKRDIIGLANTGTGKTAAFLLPIIERLYANPAPMTSLILAPTRELAQQIDDEFRRFANGQRLYSTLVVGGANMSRQIQQIKRGPHVIIGTPGRIKDLIERRVLRLATVSIFVLDEADRMCDMGFVRDIKSIANELPTERQTLCFSATMTADVKAIVEEFMVDPTTVSVVKGTSNDHIEQDVIHANDKGHKIDLLTELLKQPDFEKIIVFGETKYGVQRLADRLSNSDIPAVAIHGNKSQSQRLRALRSFKTGEVNVLVATDVAARGLDIPNVSHVINFDPPKVYEDYVHRIGRTGRAGSRGKALTFIVR